MNIFEVFVTVLFLNIKHLILDLFPLCKTVAKDDEDNVPIFQPSITVIAALMFVLSYLFFIFKVMDDNNKLQS